ncbi:hypothetical protein [Aeromicrobium sp. UC242_57]|uniref:hypothetical protein n=1 Tax=Aeromicrobium sp. UC242_57 TaxID=3374624 RepID=UPI0037A3A27F
MRNSDDDADQLGAFTMTLRMSRPSIDLTTLGSASASAVSSSSEMSGLTSSSPRTLPSTCTTHVTEDAARCAGSATGNPSRISEPS